MQMSIDKTTEILAWCQNRRLELPICEANMTATEIVVSLKNWFITIKNVILDCFVLFFPSCVVITSPKCGSLSGSLRCQ